MSYSVLWIPDGTYLDAESRDRIADLGKAGAKVVFGGDPTDGLVPDVESSEGSLLWYHRVVNGEDRYFVAATDRPYAGPVRFRGREVALALEQGESRFVFFTRKGLVKQTDPVSGKDPLPMIGKTLSLCDFKSGDMRAEFTVSARKGVKAILDLGCVEQCAEVTVNGKSAGMLWCAPYRLDVAALLEDGENRIDVVVTPTWHNRLVADAALPEAERTTWTICGPRADSPLKPAGLYGPVRFVFAE